MPTVYTVNTVNDILGDVTPNEVTLRDALTAINAQAVSGNAAAGTATNTIDFAIGAPGSVQTIDVGSGNTAAELPALTQQVFIDGWSQGGAGYTGPPLIVLNGLSAGSAANGLTLNAGSGGSTIRGLVVQSFTANGIELNGSSRNLVVGNYIGTDVSGKTGLGNANDGILLDVGSDLNTIGGTVTGAGNVISGNGFNGVEIENSASGNVLLGNRVGTDLTGAVRLGNLNDGVRISNGATANTIGGTVAGAANVISGNGDNAVRIFDPGTTGNVVLGNRIGTDVNGTAALGNFSNGVLIDSGATANTIGGIVAGSANVISGFGDNGVEIEDPQTTGNVVLGNRIGTDLSGTVILQNTNDGILLDNGTSANTIGGTAVGAGNVISGNLGDGVQIHGSGTSHNLLLGNLIGTDIHGTANLGNRGTGVMIFSGASANTIGGHAAASGNVISANGGDGVDISTASKNIVLGNLIGTDVHGTASLGNAIAGVLIFQDSASNTIGGTVAGSANVISANVVAGVTIAGHGSSGNVVLGNFIGTDIHGSARLGNGINAAPGVGDKGGVVIDTGAAQNTIGGTTAAAANIISGNVIGVEITDTASSANLVLGNRIGTDSHGTANLGNVLDGILVENGAASNAIGGTVAADANTIAFNAVGVVVSGSTSIGDRIEGNSIFSNTGPGIDLGANGFTVNSTNPRSFPNHGQNFPILTAQTTRTVSGTLTSTPKTSFRLEFFASPAMGPAGQGKTFLGFLNVITSSTGTVSFTANITAIPSGSVLTATATNLTTGDTSEFFEKATHVVLSTKPTIKFSTAAQVVSLSAQVFVGSVPVTTGAATFTIQGLTSSVTGTVSSTGEVTVKFTIPANTPKGAHTITAKYDGAGLFAISSITGVLTIS